MTTAILSTHHAPSKPATRPHDPFVCGLGDDSNCDACRTRAEREFWDRDAGAQERARLRNIDEQLTMAMGISLADLAAALLPHLAEPTAEIVGAVLDEREGAV